MTDLANTLPDTITTRDGTVHQVAGLPDPIKGLLARVVKWEKDLFDLKAEHGEVVSKLQSILEKADLVTAALHTGHSVLEQHLATNAQVNKTVVVDTDANTVEALLLNQSGRVEPIDVTKISEQTVRENRRQNDEHVVNSSDYRDYVKNNK